MKRGVWRSSASWPGLFLAGVLVVVPLGTAPGCGPGSGAAAERTGEAGEAASEDGHREAADEHHEGEVGVSVAAQERPPREESAHEEGAHPHGDEEGHAHGEEGEEHHDDGIVRLSEEQLRRAGITTAPVGPGTIDSGAELLGQVHANGDQVAHLYPRFPGLVLDVRKSVGDVVRRGDVLAVLESSESLSRYQLKTLLDGVVLEKQVTRGESVQPDKLCFVVADLSSVWVELSVYQNDLADLRVGQKVRIALGGRGTGAEGAISYITPSVDPVTRTATARVVLPNAQGSWRPGMFVTARVVADAAVDLVVPRSAIQIVEGQPSVFVQTDDGWALRAVQLGREGDQRVEVLTGLEPGESVADRNAFLLKAELGKGEAEHEH